ncbi:hypothetical protein GCM10028806_24820 [Spirosoma terrae]|uniref:Uncharacterized protein n=1 Tax=Spirosoma terrae TaxID=1968276 RepID=A0A6L9LJZ4_9BACT|nr:hypothetical protein [Spirosoma terrae]NDU96949.1 hypothetical protein [Spirosoma terrae]
MKQLNSLLLILGLLGCSGQSSDSSDTGNNNQSGDGSIARRVSGTWLLSTDYHYQDRCNYMPEEFVRNLFKLGENVELAKHSDLNSCEFRWGSNHIGFHLESEKPFESTYQSEYHFNKLFEPEANKSADSSEPKPTLFGPAPQGTGSESPADNTASTTEEDSIRGADPKAPLEGITHPTPPLATPAQNTATGVAVNGVGDKAIWEPGKKTLHVLYINHVFSVSAQMPGDPANLKQGCISLAKLVVDSLHDPTD